MITLLGLDLTGRDVLVAGGGPAAALKVIGLIRGGARVTVVAPDLCEDLIDAYAAGELDWRARDVVEADLDLAWLAVAATGDSATDEAVCRWAAARRVFAVNAGSGEHGSARMPAVTRQAGLAVGVVSEQSPDPGRIVRVRNDIERSLLTGAADLRHRRPTGGRVTLVGGGPGAEDLITVRGRLALAEADVVVTDRLGPSALLERLADGVEVIHVGKVPGAHSATQDEINAILVEQAERGRNVVRLKGGDPFLFGRGGEEVAACAAAGVAVEVVPGVSSALSVPALAGIPVTHRGRAASTLIAHGHRRLPAATTAAVAAGTTLVLLMGIARLEEHVADCLAAGADPQLPAAVIENGSLPDERVTRAPLGRLAAEARAAGVRAPAIVIVGAVAQPGLLAPTGLATEPAGSLGGLGAGNPVAGDSAGEWIPANPPDLAEAG